MTRNLTMLTDFYELTMANGYFENGIGDKIGYFDMYFRKVPDNGGFAIMAGVEQVIEYIKTLKFTDEDIEYLRSKNMFSEGFLDYLKNFKFVCDVWAIEEGTPIFPNDPLIVVRGPIIQAQFLETMILLTINHQSLIATKTNRIVRAAEGRPVMEFGSRRAQGYDGAVYGSRAAYIGGCAGTACTISEQLFDVPALGTMAHSWIQTFPDEYSAFCAYASVYPDSCTLLIDTYNVLKSGIVNAIKVHNDVLVPAGHRLKGVRIDSGDITYLTKKVRQILDENGMEDCGIVVSNSLDEYIIRDTLLQGAQINSFGVGERLITSRSEPVFGGVYKLVAIESGNEIIPRIKLSENVAKITNPGFKSLYRLYKDGKAIADVIAKHGEVIDTSKPYTIFDPEHTWKKRTLTDFEAKPAGTALTDYFESQLNECKAEIETLWDEVKRFENPHRYYVDLSKDMWQMKQNLLDQFG